MHRTRFALCPRGDTPTSTRLYDAIACGSIPVIISEHAFKMGMPFQCLVPYDLFTIQLDEQNISQDAAGALHRLFSLWPREGEAEKRARSVLRHFRRDLLWRAKGSRVADNLLLEAARWAATFGDRAEPQRSCARIQCCPLMDLTETRR